MFIVYKPRVEGTERNDGSLHQCCVLLTAALRVCANHSWLASKPILFETQFLVAWRFTCYHHLGTATEKWGIPHTSSCQSRNTDEQVWRSLCCPLLEANLNINNTEDLQRWKLIILVWKPQNFQGTSGTLFLWHTEKLDPEGHRLRPPLYTCFARHERVHVILPYSAFLLWVQGVSFPAGPWLIRKDWPSTNIGPWIAS